MKKITLLDLAQEANVGTATVERVLNARGNVSPETAERVVLAARRLGYDRRQIIQLFRFIDWLLCLPPELEERTWREIRAFEEAETMTFVTYGERIGLERGRTEGRAAGLLEGIEYMLELKFGETGTALLPEVRQIADPEILRAIMQRIKTATTIEEVRAVYASGE